MSHEPRAMVVSWLDRRCLQLHTAKIIQRGILGMKVTFTLNGKETKAEFVPGETLFHYLRSQEIYSVKNGCELGECGACTALIDNKAQNTCLVMMHTVEGKKIEIGWKYVWTKNEVKYIYKA